VSHLEHLDEGNGEVEVCEVTADERQREHDTDWDDGAQVYSAGHWNLLPRIQYSCKSSETLGHNSRKGQMPCCEDDWVVELGGVENPFVEDDNTGGEGDPDATKCQIVAGTNERTSLKTHAM